MIFIPVLPLSANNMKIWVKGRFVPSAKYARRKEEVRKLIGLNWINPVLACPVELLVIFHLKNPAKKWDLDNHLKAIKDAMSGIVYEDDKQVVSCFAKKQQTDGIEGFAFYAVPTEIQRCSNPQFDAAEKAADVVPAEKRFAKNTMTAEEFNRRYRIPAPTKFY